MITVWSICSGLCTTSSWCSDPYTKRASPGKTTTALSLPLFSLSFCLIWCLHIVLCHEQGGHIIFFQSLSLLGYCLFPLDVGAVICMLKDNVILKMVVVSVTLAWSSWAAYPFMSSAVNPRRKALALYPVFLMYVSVGFLIIAINWIQFWEKKEKKNHIFSGTSLDCHTPTIMLCSDHHFFSSLFFWLKKILLYMCLAVSVLSLRYICGHEYKLFTNLVSLLGNFKFPMNFWRFKIIRNISKRFYLSEVFSRKKRKHQKLTSLFFFISLHLIFNKESLSLK